MIFDTALRFYTTRKKGLMYNVIFQIAYEALTFDCLKKKGDSLLQLVAAVF
jgi:hypothetical protein